ncbi:MAG: DUF4177 domain-containing protein [Candidatus Coproplasma sp.]
MKEYKVELAKNLEKAEEIMNELAKEGWEVVSTAFWYHWKVGLSITFEREKAE